MQYREVSGKLIMVGALFMKKRLKVVAVILIITSLFIFIVGKKDYIFIGEERFYFGMSKVSVRCILGKPIEKVRNAHDTPFDEYEYVQKKGGQEITYTVTFGTFGLTRMYVSAAEMDYEVALSMVNESISKQRENYSSDGGYFSEQLKGTEGKTFIASNGVDDGATGIYFDYEYLYGNLSISAIKQR